MSKRYYKSAEATITAVDAMNVLPTNRPIAVYYRQSTDEQVGNISTAIQTVDMVAYLKQRGWKEDDIIMIDMDAGVSGTKKIDERPGMRMLFDLITQAEVGAVACQDEDRLFRDVTQIQVNIFIDACKTARVLVLTPSMVYDFANEQTGTFHARQFRFKSEMAAEYINSVIKGRLHRARTRLLMEGRWVGGGTPPGFMVDIRKTLPDGSQNENWRRYVPFGPYAEVVNEYFRLFLAHAGNIRATLLHIRRYGPYYPDPNVCPPPDGFRVSYRMHRYSSGYCPGRTGLIELLTNAAYLGHWLVKDAIVRWNNHPAIVPENVFIRAFNYVSDVTFDGQPNPNYSPIQQNARPSLDSERPVERPLLSGLLVTDIDGVLRRAGTKWIVKFQRYSYILQRPCLGEEEVWSKTAAPIDTTVATFLRERLSATFNPNVWEQYLTSFGHDYEQERRQKQAQLTSLERVMQNHIISLDTLERI